MKSTIFLGKCSTVEAIVHHSQRKNITQEYYVQKCHFRILREKENFCLAWATVFSSATF